MLDRWTLKKLKPFHFELRKNFWQKTIRVFGSAKFCGVFFKVNQIDKRCGVLGT